MNNKYLYMVMSGLGVVLWYLIGKSGYIGSEGDFTDNWRLGTVIAVALGFGNGSGESIFEVFIGSIKDYIPHLMSIALASAVAISVWQLLVEGISFDLPRAINVVATYIGAAVTTSIMISYFKKSIP